MSTIITEPIVDAPSTAPNLDDGSGDPENLAHIVNQNLPGNNLMQAMVEGTEVVAMCGHRFVPYRRAEQFPVCKACRDALAATD
jgi:hypothetical protein